MEQEIHSLRTLFVPDIDIARYANIPIKKQGNIEFGYLEFYSLEELTEIQREIVEMSTLIK